MNVLYAEINKVVYKMTFNGDMLYKREVLVIQPETSSLSNIKYTSVPRRGMRGAVK